MTIGRSKGALRAQRRVVEYDEGSGVNEDEGEHGSEDITIDSYALAGVGLWTTAPGQDRAFLC